MGVRTMDRPTAVARVPGTVADDLDMRRMHKPQELNVSYTMTLKISTSES